MLPLLRVGLQRIVGVIDIVLQAMLLLQAKARQEGLWNLFLPGLSGLSNVDYAHIAEQLGRGPHIYSEIFNCSAPGKDQYFLRNIIW